MDPLTIFPAVEQAAEHFRKELLWGSLSGTKWGANPLAAELGINHKTMAEFRQSVEEGLLGTQCRATRLRGEIKFVFLSPGKTTAGDGR